MSEETQVPVQMVEEKVQLPKEMNDVRVLLVELVKDVKAKKSPMAIASENLPLLIAAGDGMDKLAAEAKSAAAVDLAALLAADITKILLGKA